MVDISNEIGECTILIKASFIIENGLKNISFLTKLETVAWEK